MRCLSEQIVALKKARVCFAVATVVKVRGSASARPGSKALINSDGQNIAGWVGGGCAESYICAQALESIQVREPRVVTADLDDEIFGLGVPCGGVMDVYIEPVLPANYFSLPHPFRASQAGQIATWHLLHLGFELREGQPAPGDISWSDQSTGTLLQAQPSGAPRPNTSHQAVLEALLGVAESLANFRQRSFLPMSKAQAAASSLRKMETTACVAPPTNLWITGRGRITEELAQLGAQLKWPVTVISSVADRANYPSSIRILNEDEAGLAQLQDGDVVVIASHHRRDPEWIAEALQSGARYVGLIASQHRVGLVSKELIEKTESLQGSRLRTPLALDRLHAPAGLDLGCQNPSEIALSIIVEILKYATIVDEKRR
jgi:xanthine/CO dehydrogenase XdhC/CoxF family maturation factor